MDEQDYDKILEEQNKKMMEKNKAGSVQKKAPMLKGKEVK